MNFQKTYSKAQKRRTPVPPQRELSDSEDDNGLYKGVAEKERNKEDLLFSFLVFFEHVYFQVGSLMRTVGTEPLQMKTATPARTRTLMPNWVKPHRSTRDPAVVSTILAFHILPFYNLYYTVEQIISLTTAWMISQFSRFFRKIKNVQDIYWKIQLIFFRASERNPPDQRLGTKHNPKRGLQVRQLKHLMSSLWGIKQNRLSYSIGSV